MKRRISAPRLLRWIVLVVAFISSANGLAGEYCAIRITVLDPNGRPQRGPVLLRTQDGKWEQTVIAGDDGVAEFCDTGFVLHEAVVGSNVCGQVVLRYIAPLWLEPLNLKVTYQNCHSNLPSAGCHVIFRLRSPEGRAVEGVEFRGIGVPTETRSDRYGRIMITVPWGKAIDGHFVRAGFRYHPVQFECRQQGETMVDRLVTLARENAER